MARVRQTPELKFEPYLLVDAIEALRYAKNRLSYSTKQSCEDDCKKLGQALSSYSDGGVLPGTGLSFDLVALHRSCQSVQDCKCYRCRTDAIIDSLQARGIANSYVEKIVSRWNQLIRQAMKQGKIPYFELGNLPLERKIKPEITVLSVEEISHYLKVVEDPRARAVLFIGCSAGLRIQETLHLRKENIVKTPDGYLLDVKAKFCVGHKSCLENKPPNEAVRGMKDPPKLGWWKVKTRENRQAFCSPNLRPYLAETLSLAKDSRWLFPGAASGYPMARVNIIRLFRLGMIKAGLYKPGGRYGTHICRRTYITGLLRKKNLTTAQVAKMAGCTINNIENYLAHDPRVGKDYFDF